MAWIIVLFVLGLVLYFAELVLLPGITLAAVGAFCALTGAIVWSFADYGDFGWWVAGGSVIGVGGITLIFLRARTWRRVSLSEQISNSVSQPLAERFSVGQRGVALTRLAPGGNITVGGVIVEARLLSGFADQGSSVEVIGFDGPTVLVGIVS